MTTPLDQLAECIHFWDIEPANGPTSRGCCELCGTKRIFQNCIPELADGYNYELGRMNDILFGKATRFPDAY